MPGVLADVVDLLGKPVEANRGGATKMVTTGFSAAWTT